MSMGYDDDDPRRAETRQRLIDGYWSLKPGEKANTTRKSAMPSNFAARLKGK